MVMKVDKELMTPEDSLLDLFTKGTHHTVGNKTEIRSMSIDTLGRILDFSQYRPTAVQFYYVYHDNSGKNERLAVPGPSDMYLEALMYFDSAAWEGMSNFERHLEWKTQDKVKEEFDFGWLPPNVYDELMTPRLNNYHGHPDFFFGTVGKGRLWYLNRKVLLTYSSY